MSLFKITREKILNFFICVLLGWVLYNIMLFPYGRILIPLVLEKSIPFFILHIYFFFVFLNIGIVIGLITKTKPWAPTIGVMVFILITFTLIDTNAKKSLLNFMTVSQTALIIFGGYLGWFLKKRKKDKQEKNKKEEEEVTV